MQHSCDYIFIRHNSKFVKVNLSDVLYLESRKNFVCIHSTSDPVLVLITLKRIEEELPDYFCRVHRAYIVNSRQVDSFDYEHAWFGKKWVPVSQPYREALLYKVKVVVPQDKPFPGISMFKVDALQH